MPPSRLLIIPLVAIVAAVAGSGCNDDGRTLRPAQPDQTESVSTITVATTGDVATPLTLPPTLPVTLPTTAAPTLAPATFTVTAPWGEGGVIPVRHTCDGDDVAPALRWGPVPAGTQEIAVAMTDLDVPGYVHWVMADLDPMATDLVQGEVPEFAVVGVNGVGRTDYSGPCPPAGETHRYRVTVYLLAQRTELGDGASGTDLLASIEGSAYVTASVTGVYTRP